MGSSVLSVIQSVFDLGKFDTEPYTLSSRVRLYFCIFFVRGRNSQKSIAPIVNRRAIASKNPDQNEKLMPLITMVLVTAVGPTFRLIPFKIACRESDFRIIRLVKAACASIKEINAA